MPFTQNSYSLHTNLYVSCIQLYALHMPFSSTYIYLSFTLCTFHTTQVCTHTTHPHTDTRTHAHTHTHTVWQSCCLHIHFSSLGSGAILQHLQLFEDSVHKFLLVPLPLLQRRKQVVLFLVRIVQSAQTQTGECVCVCVCVWRGGLSLIHI